MHGSLPQATANIHRSPPPAKQNLVAALSICTKLSLRRDDSHTRCPPHAITLFDNEHRMLHMYICHGEQQVHSG